MPAVTNHTPLPPRHTADSGRPISCCLRDHAPVGVDVRALASAAKSICRAASESLALLAIQASFLCTWIPWHYHRKETQYVVASVAPACLPTLQAEILVATAAFAQP